MRDGNEIELDFCKGGCGGIWFDRHEFLKFDKPHENVSKILGVGFPVSVANSKCYFAFYKI